MDLLRRALALDAQGASVARVYLGSALAVQGEFQEAREQLQSFLADAPDHVEAESARRLLARLPP